LRAAVAVITDAEDQIAAAPIGERRYVAKQLGYSLGQRVVELEFEVEVLARSAMCLDTRARSSSSKIAAKGLSPKVLDVGRGVRAMRSGEYSPPAA
jgi:hypothetical protein